ncbi:uncharacterized protein LOC130136759 [Syzygium oleosum]|uniref:uncharacterized protein LOC130136759 n=1 Tax=Syzygium oleosum TaxID=219896 RepID=UPI0024BA5902|nr:uncharacterized protein LOC130136759 [Syzygium oleosum]
MKMATSVLLVLLLVVTPVAYGVVHTITDWCTQGDHQVWADGEKFLVNDILVFEYEVGHKVEHGEQRRLRELQETQCAKILRWRQDKHYAEHAGLDLLHVSVLWPLRKRHEDGNPSRGSCDYK